MSFASTVSVFLGGLIQAALGIWGGGTLADEPLRGAEKRGVKRGLAGGKDCVGLPEVELVGRNDVFWQGVLDRAMVHHWVKYNGEQR